VTAADAGARKTAGGGRPPDAGARQAAFTAERRLLEFPHELRRAGVMVDSAAAAGFLAAVACLPPASLQQFRRLARLALVRRREDFAAFDAVFDAHFLAAASAERLTAPDEEEISESDQTVATKTPPLLADGGGGGRSASPDEGLGRRSFAAAATSEASELQCFSATLAAVFPCTRSRRRRPAARGDRLDVRKTLTSARHTGGEPMRLFWSARPSRRRRLLLLVDVSGSLKEHSPRVLRIARAAVRSGVRTEVFTFATRLTRITSALSRHDAEASAAALADLVRDADGGTRIGPSLAALIADPRHQALMRGAVIAVVSDGLERGDPQQMHHAVDRLARLGHRLVWLTPLAANPDYKPETRAMRAIASSLDLLDDSTTIAAFARAAAALPALERAPRGRAVRAASLDRRP
jgi:uncharacterized protein with von Willebrand factor type A (vWA) domain